MKDQSKTKQVLIQELASLRQKIAELDKLESNRRQAEEVMRENEGRFNAMLQSIPDHMSVMDKDLNIVWANETALRIFGGNIIGRKCYEAYHGRKEPCEPYPCLTLKAFQDGGVHEHDTDVVDTEGQTIHFHCTANVALRDKNDNPLAVLEISRNITEARQLEEKLKKSHDRYRELSTLLESLFNAIPDILGIQDNQHGIIRYNQAGYDFLGCTQQGVEGKKCFELINRTSPCEICATSEVYKTKKPARVEKYIEDMGIWLDCRSYPVFDEKGNITKIIEHLCDITERKQAENALRESEDKYRVLVEAAGEAIFIAQEGIIKFCNKRFSDISGYESADLANMPFNDLVHSDDRQMVFDRYIQRLEGKDVPSRYRFRFIDAWGNTRWADMSVALISWEGKPSSLCLAADITELKQAEEALKRSEEKYRYLFERASEGILVARGVTLEFVNPALVRILGYPLEKITSEPFINFIHPDDQAMVVDHHLRRMRGESVETGYDFRIITSDGTVKWLTINSQVIGWEGAPANLSFIADITERKKAEEELRIFMESVENSSDAVGMSTSEGKHYYQNKAFDELFGRVGENPPETLYVYPAVGHEVFRAIMAGGQWTGEVQMYAKDRGILDILLRAYANKDKSGRITALVGIHTDITERKRSEAEREKLQAQLARAQKLESIGTLAGGIAHDFNNLLMGIQGHASLMMLGLEPSDPRHVRLKHIEELIQSGADLTGQLLGFARGGRYDVKPVSMNDIVEKSSAMFGRTKKEINIHRKYAKDPCIVEADRSQMEQVFMNLFVNAWQAMPGGGDMFVETEKVVLDEAYAIPGALAPGRYVKVTVTDTGTGMDAQTKERIFDPFFTTKGMGRGTGLGLATVYGIMRGHGGMITAESEPGQGTTFTLYVPASENDPDEEGKPAKGVLRGTETILLVDDEKMVLEVSRELLESLGYRVYAAGSGQEAVAVYMEKKGEISLVVLDMVMPGISGGETFDRLREINPQVKVLLASGYSINGQAQDIIDRGCDGFIQKPFRLKELSRRVREALD